MIKPIKILNDLITNLNHVVNVSNTVDNGDGTFTLTVDNTYYLTINKFVSINGTNYQIVDFELNSWIKISGTIQPTASQFQINSPKFVHGTPKMVNVEHSFNNEYPFIWLVEFTEVDYNNDYSVNLTAKLDLNLLFLTDINYEDWLIKDHYINAIYPMANEIDFIIKALNNRKDLFADIDNYKVINHVNFGDYVTNNGYDSKILTDQLSGCQLKLTLPYVVDLCSKSEVKFCKPSVISANGVEIITITGVNYDLQILDQDGNQVGFLNNGNWEVFIPNNIVNSSGINKTGATISYQTNDDGALKFGNAVDFFTLDFNNKFGNTNRFTDDLGGQTYASDVVIDWSTFNQVNGTVLAYYRVPEVAKSLTNQLNGQPYTKNSISGWYVCNIRQLLNLFYYGVYRNLFNYHPFNIDATATADQLWSSTRDSATAGYFCSSLGTSIAGHSGLRRALLCREYTLTELGL